MLAKLLSEMKVNESQVQAKDIIPVEFEKDDDANFHIAFIHATANLRARNYRIEECDFFKTKIIAGKIIPAVATTTAMITGCVSGEMFKVVQGVTNIEKYSNGFINLALPLFVFSEPDAAKKIKSKEYDPILAGPVKAIPEGYTIWDKVKLKGPLTFQQFFDHLKQQSQINVTLVSSGTFALYNGYLPGNKHAARLARNIEDVYFELCGKDNPLPEGRTYLSLDIAGETLDDGADFSTPVVMYHFK